MWSQSSQTQHKFCTLSSFPPRLLQDEAAEDELLGDPKAPLPAELKAKLPHEPPEPEAAPTKADERPAMLQALETAAFDDGEDEEEGEWREEKGAAGRRGSVAGYTLPLVLLEREREGGKEGGLCVRQLCVALTFLISLCDTCNG